MLQVEQALAKTRRRHNGATSRCFLMFAVRNLCTRLNIPNHSKPVSIVSTCVLWGYVNLPGMFTLVSFLLVILVFISNLLHPGVPGRVLLRHIREQPSYSCGLGGWKRHVQGRSVVSQGATTCKTKRIILQVAERCRTSWDFRIVWSILNFECWIYFAFLGFLTLNLPLSLAVQTHGSHGILSIRAFCGCFLSS